MKIRHGLAKQIIFIGCYGFVFLALIGLYPVYAASQESNESIGKHILLPTNDTNQVFKLNEDAISHKQKRLELIYLNKLLRDPVALAEKITLQDTSGGAGKTIENLEARRNELIKEFIANSKKHIKNDTTANQSISPRPPPPPLDPHISRIDSFSLIDVLEGMKIYTADGIRERRLGELEDRSCAIRQGKITQPDSFTIRDKSLMGDGEANGNITYRIDEGTLPFTAYLYSAYPYPYNPQGPVSTYIMQAQLSYDFPAPLCDSTLSWEFKLGAGAELGCSSDHCMVYLDHYVLEQPNIDVEVEPIVIMTAGSLLEINENTLWDGIKPITVSGQFDVDARNKSKLWVLTIVSLWGSYTSATTDGIFQIYTEWGGFAPGVRYRLDPR